MTDKSICPTQDAGLTEIERQQLDEYLTMVEERFPPVSYYVTKAIFKVRAWLAASPREDGGEDNG